MKNYDHKKIEKKWQKEWEKKKIYQAKNNSKSRKFYGLIEFPYPSGAGLHVGHVRSNTAMDIIARKRRMEGYNVLYPIGWDAFGLPTENYAIKTGIHPTKVTKQNTDTFRRQLKEIGFSFDWSREVDTTDPKYYKWTQWIFLQFFNKGLAYKAKTEINWCPKDKIGLANEEAEGGVCDRCGGPVEKREKEQWMLAITKYADRLDKDLAEVNYLEKIKVQQRNWIGKSEGAEIDFDVKNSTEKIKIFTTRADTIFGAFAVILAPEHTLVAKMKDKITNWREVSEYINKTLQKSDIERTGDDKDKSGVELKGIRAINPSNQEEVPIWIADFVLVSYGTGAVFADMHDERDFDFAKKYNLKMRQVVMPILLDSKNPPRLGKKDTKRDVVHVILRDVKNKKILVEYLKDESWGPHKPVNFIIGGIEEGESEEEAARREIREETGYTNVSLVEKLEADTCSNFFQAQKDVNREVHVRTLVFDLLGGEQDQVEEEEKNHHEVKWVPESEVLKEINVVDDIYAWKFYQSQGYAYTDEGILINSGQFSGLHTEEARNKIIDFVGGKKVTKFKLRDWVFSRQRYWGEPIPIIKCGECGYVPVPLKDLPVKLPNVKSYVPTDTGESPLAGIKSWVKTKCPNCKREAERETDTMPNWAGSSWYYLRYTDPKNNKEFASKKALNYWIPEGVDWYNGGMEHTTLHLLYSRFWHKFLYDLKLVPTSEPYGKRTSHGMILAEGGVKMSKSLGNTVDPKDIVKIYGADTLRLYEMFIGPFDQTVSWSTDSIVGPRRFLERVWKVKDKVKEKSVEGVPRLLNKTIKKVTEDIEEMRFNTAISSMMIFVAELQNFESISKDDFKTFLKLLSPFAPHITEELWMELGEKKSIHISQWPTWDENLLTEDQIKIVVQTNGKLRATILVVSKTEEEEIKNLALKEENVVKILGDKKPKKIIYVKDRLINIVF
jgi:leucyl-tRNA synthetase